MNTSTERSSLLKFFDAFLQERNIKWILAVGLAILFGSSAMLVATDWESFPPLAKFATLLAYTAVLFAAGEFSHHRLGLQRTGTFLKLLVVLLVPLDFLALRWLPAEQSSGAITGPLGFAAWIVAGGAGFAFAAFAARRIFGHFLRGPQPTFLGAYLVLCAAGALPAAWALHWPLLHTLCLWAVFTAGTVKVNRHVFWLVEERRFPRICGFAPIALLGAQFVTLFVLQAAPRLATDWLGLACALAAVPVLLTADAVLRVFEQRTGGLVRPMPAAIVLPFFLGLALCAVGLWLAATGWPRPYALVPAATLTALSLGVAAVRSRRPVFVWCMLALALVAYRFCPLYFAEAARLVVEHSAAAVKEQRLPLAFYGLTCLPFIAGMMTAGRWLERRHDRLFAPVLRQFSIVLAALLLIVSFTHVKAILPVGAAMTVVFAAQAWVFRDARLLWPTALAFAAAAFGFAPFVRQVLEWTFPADGLFLCLASAAALLLWPARRFERALQARMVSGAAESTRRPMRSRPFRDASLVVTLALGVGWLVWTGGAPAALVPWISAGLIAALLTTHALARPAPVLGEAALVFSLAAGLTLAARLGATFPALVSAATVANAALWGTAIGLRRFPQMQVSRAFAEPAFRVSLVALAVLTAYHASTLLVVSFGLAADVSWVCGLLVAAWGFDAAWRVRRPWPAWLACAAVLPLVSATLAMLVGAATAMPWYPAAWALLALAALPVANWLRRRALAVDAGLTTAAQRHTQARALAAIAEPVHTSALGVLVLAGFATLPMFAWELRLAGGIAAAGLLLAARLRGNALLAQLGVVAANWHVLALVLAWCAPDAGHLSSLAHAQLMTASIPLAAAASLSVLATGPLLLRLAGANRDVLLAHRFCLQVTAIWMLFLAAQTGPRVFASLEVLGIVAAFSALAADLLWSACRERREQHVWLAEGLVGAGIAYLALLGVIALDHGTTMFAVLGAALLLSCAAVLVSRGRATAVLERPFRQTATFLPLATVGLGLVRHLTHTDPQWLGFNSLALLLTAGFYFWLGLERRQRRYIALAAGVLNAALAMFWSDLAWSDPQFYMVPLGITVLGLVELLKPEIPRELRNPLRYVGALVVLVSPTFHIVDGSWIHLFTLMVASVAITLVGIGLRIRVLAYLGTGFLAADLVAMVVRGSLDHPNLLWFAGLAVGAGVIALAAFCENHRETLLSRLRLLTSELETWE